jgi:hypothetical protein
MSDEAQHPQPEHDPLTIGELISLQQAAEYAQLKKDSLHDYIKRGRLKVTIFIEERPITPLSDSIPRQTYDFVGITFSPPRVFAPACP